MLNLMKRIESAMDKELPLAMSYTGDVTDTKISYDICWTERAKTISAQNKLRQDIIDFGKRHGAVEISDNNINVITLTFSL